MTTTSKSGTHAIFSSITSSLLLTALAFSPVAQAQQKPVAKPASTKVIDRSSVSASKGSATATKTTPVAQSPSLSDAKAGSNLPGTAVKTDNKVEVVATPQETSGSIAARHRGSWSMFLHNACRTGNSYIDSLPATVGRVKWTFPAEGGIDSSPAIYKGVIYVGSDDGHVYALDEQNGKMLWRATLGDKVKSSPAIADGMLVIGCEDKKVYGLNSTTGKVLWTFETKDRVSSSPALHEGTAYVGSWDGNLYALDFKTGKLRWQFPGNNSIAPQTSTDAAVSSVITTATVSGNVVGDNKSVATDVATGTAANGGTAKSSGAANSQNPSTNSTNTTAANSDNYPAGAHTADSSGAVTGAAGVAGIPLTNLGRITSSPCVGPGVVVVTAHNGFAYCLSTKDGRMLWQFRTGGKLMASPMIMDNMVYFGSWDHAFYAVDLATGKQKWKAGAAESFSIAATGAAGKVYVGNDDLKLYCYDAHSGKVIWKTQLNSPSPLLSSSPAIAGGMIFCGSPDANVYAIDNRNGGIKWKFKTQRAIVSSPAVSAGGICIGSQDGNLYWIN